MLGSILYECTIGKLTLPASLNYDFSLNASMDTTFDEIVLPDSLEIINDSLFRSVSVNKITLPSNLKTIEDKAFEYTSLKEIRIPLSVTSIGVQAFAYPENNLTIIFEGRNNLDGITFGNSWNSSLDNKITIAYD